MKKCAKMNDFKKKKLKNCRGDRQRMTQEIQYIRQI